MQLLNRYRNSDNNHVVESSIGLDNTIETADNGTSHQSVRYVNKDTMCIKIENELKVKYDQNLSTALASTAQERQEKIYPTTSNINS